MASDGAVRFIIPNGAVIPARDHFLAVNTDGYSLCADPVSGPCYAVPDDVLLPDGVTTAGGYNVNILDESDIAIFRTANPAFFTADERLDAVGYSSVPALYREGTGLTPGLGVGGEQDYSWLRQMCAFALDVGCTTPDGNPIEDGETVSVQFQLGIEKTGTFRFYVNVEAFDDCACPAASEAQKGQPRVGVLKSANPRPRIRRGRSRR